MQHVWVFLDHLLLHVQSHLLLHVQSHLLNGFEQLSIYLLKVQVLRVFVVILAFAVRHRRGEQNHSMFKLVKDD
jgi:hypothetical protein